MTTISNQSDLKSRKKAKKDRNWRKSAQFELDMLSKGL